MSRGTGEKAASKAASKAATHMPPSDITQKQARTKNPRFPAELAGVGASCDCVESHPTGRGGLEDTHYSPEKTPISKSRGAECGAPTKTDPDLARIVSAWPALSVAAKALLLAFVTDPR